ncbi:hypothetical protein L9G16_00730 [Shewanella sp. A25]|nr:hypothetical protein [Shewanella shenzhenensis]
MEERRHSFSVSSSFDQRLSLVVFILVCSTSFLVWPSTDNLLLSLLKYVLIAVVFVFLIHSLWRLGDWQRRFSLNANGEGRLEDGEVFYILKETRVTPFVCLIYYVANDKKQLLPIWADMLSDTDYRHLCRLLLQAKTKQAKSHLET